MYRHTGCPHDGPCGCGAPRRHARRRHRPHRQSGGSPARTTPWAS